MPEPSDGGSVTQTPPTPVTGTPETDERSVTKTSKRSVNLTVDDVDIEELKHQLKNATEERDRHRKKLSAYEEAEKKAQEAKLSEIELAKKQQAELSEQMESLAAELAESRVRQDVADNASKFNFTIGAKTLANLLLTDFDAIEFENGRPTNIEKLLDKLAKAEPDLVKKEQDQRPPSVPAMNPGRSSINSPGTGTPRQIPSWNEVYKRP